MRILETAVVWPKPFRDLVQVGVVVPALFRLEPDPGPVSPAPAVGLPG